MDAERKARIADLAAAVQPTWAENQDGSALQDYLKGIGCNGVDAVMVTMQVVGCDLREAQRMFFSAPCRGAERAFHNAAMEVLERSQSGV
ncbi:hypothetical protein ACIPY6_01765 [Streptomyces sp. NPDC090054]|uniref:hypothetical protein n=1 Tax=Streptomyces sp. NPDC090054 TaxID=3365933 RepID=UPI003826DD1A